MKVTPRSRQVLRLHNVVFVLLFLAFLGLLGWLSTRYVYESDWTVGGRNTLSEASTTLLKGLQGEVVITAYAREASPLVRKRITEMVGRYQRRKPDIKLVFVNPDQEPEKTRELGITTDGELVIEYQGRSERLEEITESGLTNALQRVARGGERRLFFLTGHGERDPGGDAGYDYLGFAQQLRTKGITVDKLNLAQTPQVPPGATALAIVSPKTDLLPGEVKLITDYVEHGGNVLWLMDPGSMHGLEPLAKELGLDFERGVVLDPNVSRVGLLLFGTNDPRAVLVASYPPHDITRDFDLNTLFPIAGALKVTETGGWHATEILHTLSNTWLATGEISGAVRYQPGKDMPGPLTLGVALNRDRPGAQQDKGDKKPAGSTPAQRIVAVTDADFLSNAFLGVGGNLQLGLNVVNWLSSDDRLIEIPVRTAPDLSLQFSRFAMATIGFGFLLVVPAALVGSGLTIWLRRRRR
jgi:ABC-type uncharacterized transport system involved in gliding motility auxiliary subunit